MQFEIAKAFPTDRDSAIAELTVRHDGIVDIPAEIKHENGKLTISIFGREGGTAWTYLLDDWLEAIQRAVEVLGDDSSADSH